MISFLISHSDFLEAPLIKHITLVPEMPIILLNHPLMLTLDNNCYLIWLNCRLAVRQAAANIKKFASSIAPHITTILVHGKQVMSRQKRSKDPACVVTVS